PPTCRLFPYTTLFRSQLHLPAHAGLALGVLEMGANRLDRALARLGDLVRGGVLVQAPDRVELGGRPAEELGGARREACGIGLVRRMHDEQRGRAGERYRAMRAADRAHLERVVDRAPLRTEGRGQPGQRARAGTNAAGRREAV